jgi:hypothetical protein
VTDANQVGQPTPKSTTYTWQVRMGCNAPGYTHLRCSGGGDVLEVSRVADELPGSRPAISMRLGR